MTPTLLARPRMSGFVVLLLVDPPPAENRSEAETPGGRYEAIIACARAVLAGGGQLAVPVDFEIALTLGTVALGYTEPPVAERRGNVVPTPPLVVFETERAERGARTLLSPLAIRGALSYVDADGSPVALQTTLPEPSSEFGEGIHRHRMTPQALEVIRPSAAMFVSPDRGARSELELLRSANVPTIALRDVIVSRDVLREFQDVEDPTDRLLEGRAGRWTPGEEFEEAPGVRPYSYLMQRLVSEWIADRR